MQQNKLELFKDTDPRMAEFIGQDRIFFHELCTGRRASYNIETINWMFETQHNPEYLLQRMVSLMEGLQTQHTGLYAAYENAEEEYPKLYALLCGGLSDKAFERISCIDMSEWTQAEPKNLGQQFCTQLLEERAASNRLSQKPSIEARRMAMS